MGRAAARPRALLAAAACGFLCCPSITAYLLPPTPSLLLRQPGEGRGWSLGRPGPRTRLPGLSLRGAREQGARLAEQEETIWHVMPEDGPDSTASQFVVGLWTASEAVLDLRGSHQGVWSEAVEGVNGAVVLHNVLSEEECDEIVALTERMGYVEYDLKKNTHSAVTWIASLEAVVKPLYERCRQHLPQVLPSRDFSFGRNITSLNGRLRCYRYKPDGSQTFRRHLDDSFLASGLDKPGGNRFVWDVSDGAESSMMTFLLYLSDDFEGGHTVFHPHCEDLGGSFGVSEPVAVRPQKGSVLCFYQTLLLGEEGDEVPWELAPLHEGSVLAEREGASPKYVIRSDVMYTHAK